MKKLLLICFLTLQSFAFDVEDISIMREMGVLIAFPSEQKAHPIPSSMRPSEMMKVNYLNFNGKALYFLPAWLPKMTNISRLELKDTKITLKELQKLRPLTQLDILDISDNPLFKDGGNLVELLSTFSLTQLNLSNTGGGSSSADYANIGSLSSLIKLDLSGNVLSYISPLKLKKFPNLRELNLSDNLIRGILYTDNLPKNSLRELYLFGNNISRFTFSGDFPALRVLDISNNQQQLIFDEEYGNPYMFKKLKQGKFNDDIKLPQSIMTRLGIKPKEIILARLTPKLRTPTKTECERGGGKVPYEVCNANWENAKKICHKSGGRLPTIEEVKKVVNECGGNLILYDDNNNFKNKILKGKNNSSYLSCIHKGYTSPSLSDLIPPGLFIFWSSTTYKDNDKIAWLVFLDNEGAVSGDKTVDLISVFCMY